MAGILVNQVPAMLVVVMAAVMVEEAMVVGAMA
jgi:hypothetical protein